MHHQFGPRGVLMPKQWAAVASLVTVVILAAAAFWVSRDTSSRSLAPFEVSPQPFDRAGWASGSARLRIAMARHLTASGQLAGKSAAELTDLLGPPGPESTGTELSWYLGPRRSGAALMFPYQEYLVVALDDQGTSERAHIVNRD